MVLVTTSTSLIYIYLPLNRPSFNLHYNTLPHRHTCALLAITLGLSPTISLRLLRLPLLITHKWLFGHTPRSRRGKRNLEDK